uniref:Uncharacterized protein n=1 Tax=Solanum lycopersicum TaxID=4081 RepID=A0A3Q7FKG2_SOLLC
MNLRSFIIKECEQQNWEGIITRIWPNTKYLDVIVTGHRASQLCPSMLRKFIRGENVLCTVNYYPTNSPEPRGFEPMLFGYGRMFELGAELQITHLTLE